MFDDLAFDRRNGLFGGVFVGGFGGSFGHPVRILPPEAPLAMPRQVIERGRAGHALGHGGWLRRLLFSVR